MLPRGVKYAHRTIAQNSAILAARERNRKPGKGQGGISM
jgi:hypothetical protein